MDRTLFPTIIVTILVFLIIEFTGIDLWVQDHFYDFEANSWLVDAKSSAPRFWFYTGPKTLIWIFGILTIAAALFYPTFARLFPKKIPHRLDLLVVIATLITAPTLVALGKATTNTFTPSQVRRYNGEQPYVKVIESYAPEDRPTKRGRAFPAGHASGGFALLSLAGLACTTRGRLLGVLTGLTVGTAMGLYQMFKGAHYLSHTLITLGICWVIFLSYRRLFRRHH